MTGIRQASGPNLVLERSRELYALGRRESQAGGRRMAVRTQTAPSSAARWLILKPGYRTDLGRAPNAPRVDAREEGSLSVCSECPPENRPRAETGANRGMTVSRKPASIGRFRAGRPETRVNNGLAGRWAGNARKQWASG